MLDLRICPHCGDKAENPQVSGNIRVCGQCGHRWPFRRLPLFALTGPSGAGKSTVGPQLAARMSDRVVVLEQDVLWVAGLRDDIDGHPDFRSVWLRMAAMIHQNGRPIVLCGTVVPPEFEDLPERVFFSDIHYLALVGADDVLRQRLEARPQWREWSSDRIDEMLIFNRWLQDNAATLRPPVELFDTTSSSVSEAISRAQTWISERL